MISYAFRRLLGALPTLLILLTLLFFLLRLAPGGPFDGERAFPPEVKAAIDANYGLNLPLGEQYLIWFKGMLSGNWGESFQYIGRPVMEMIFEALPASLILGGLSLMVSIFVGIPLGLVSAYKQGSFWDKLSIFFAVSGVSLPAYLVASLLVLIFSIHFSLLPAALWESWTSLVLPVFTLALRPAALIARLTRASALESLSSDYVRTAVAKGLATHTVLFKHTLKNSLIPVVTLLGPITASLVTGSFLVEIVFQLPGLGKYFVNSVMNRDYPLVMAITFVYGAFLVICNLASDLLCALLDPRIRLGEKNS
jgi:oligopeptide transport system permease protein